MSKQKQRVRRLREAAALALGILACLGLGGVRSADAQIEGVSYTLTPSVEILRWDNDLGLDDDVLFGGRFSLNAGRFAAVEAYYLTNPNVRTQFSDTDLDVDGTFTLPDQDVELDSYGANVTFNLSSGPLVPFLRGGGGVMRFDPDAGSSFQAINLRAGGGLRFNLFERLRAEASIEDQVLRVDRYRLAVPVEGGFPVDPDHDDLRHNLTFGLGVNLLLGGYSGAEDTDLDRAFRERFTQGLFGASIPIEPFIGRIEWEDDLFPRQEFLGLRTGVDLGPNFGLRAYYWRGFEGGFEDTERIQSWGGEGLFKLNSGPGIQPFLALGAGQLDFMSGFAGRTGQRPDDELLLIAGGGLGVPIGDRFRVQVAARDLMFSASDLEDTSDPDQIRHNLMYSAGFTFSIGGREAPDMDARDLSQRRERTVRGAAMASGPDTVRVYVPVRSEDIDFASELDRRDMKRSLEDRRMGASADVRRTGMGDDRMMRTDRPGAAEGMVSPVRTQQGDQVVTLPVPEQGEIYIRFGEPGGVNIRSQARYSDASGRTRTGGDGMPAAYRTESDEIRAAVREELERLDIRPGDLDVDRMGERGAYEDRDMDRSRDAYRDESRERDLRDREYRDERRDEMRDEDRAPFREGEPQQDRNREPADRSEIQRDLEDRIDERMDAMEERLMAAIEERDRAAEMQPSVGPRQAAPITRQETATGPAAAQEPGRGFEINGIRGYTGLNVDEPNQMLLGGRINLGPVSPNSSFVLVPELALGFFDETSFMAAGNIEYSLGEMGTSGIRPYVMGGLGILTFSDDVEDRDQTEAVANIGYGFTRDFENFTGFIEHQGIDLFSLNRILLGLTWNTGSAPF